MFKYGKGNLKNKESKNVLIYVKLIWVVSIMVLTYGYAKIIIGLFKLLSDIRYTSFSIILLIAMFIFGLVFCTCQRNPYLNCNIGILMKFKK